MSNSWKLHLRSILFKSELTDQNQILVSSQRKTFWKLMLLRLTNRLEILLG